MTTRTSTLLALPLLLGLTTGAAQATLLEIELTGTIVTAMTHQRIRIGHRLRRSHRPNRHVPLAD